MKRIMIIMLLLITGKVVSQELPLELFKDIDKCFVKTHRIIPDYDLKRTYITTKTYYEFDDQGRIREIMRYGGNNAYQGYYSYSYSDTLDVRSFFSTHNVITERFTTKYLNDHGDTEETLYSWGGKLLSRVISSTDPEKHQTNYEYYNDAGYPLYSDVKVKFPDGRIEKIITYDYDGFPVYYDYFNYDENKRLDSQRKIDYRDTLVTVVEYDYSDNNSLIKKATIDFKKNRSLVENFVYDILGRLSLETVYEKSQDFGGIEELVMKREIYYENYEEIKDSSHKGDDARDVLEEKLALKAERDAKRLAKIKAKQDKEREKAEKKEQARLEKERMLLEERDVYKLEEIEKEKEAEKEEGEKE
ncbi:hypothetical protein JEZ13_12570 [bacterium]|nr:hypothetical protein [bacterium]